MIERPSGHAALRALRVKQMPCCCDDAVAHSRDGGSSGR